MKWIIAIALVIGSLSAPSSFAQSQSEPAPEEDAVESMPPVDGQPSPATAPEVAAEPAPVAATPTAVAPRVQATVQKLDHIVCPVGTTPPSSPGGCIVGLLPNPSNPLPPLSQYDWSPGPISQIPSPVGAPIFSSFHRPIGSEDYIEFRLSPAALVTYSFGCPVVQCTGSAQDVWRAMPAVQREEYLVAVVQAERANQSWGPSRFSAAVVALDPGQELQGRGCAAMTETDQAIRFAPSCVGPFQDHLAQ